MVGPAELGTVRRGRTWVTRAILLVVCIGAAAAERSPGQEATGTTWSVGGGGALGLYSGVLLGTIGSLTPCTETWIGPRCVRWSALAAGSIGLASGIAVGVNDRDRVAAQAAGAGVGFAVGLAAGAALKPFVQRFSWADAATVGLVGGAIGTAPVGAALGLAVGGAVGVALLPRIELPSLVGVALAGLALGGLTEWVIRAAEGPPDPGPELQFVLPLSVSF